MKTPLPPLPDCSGSPHLSDIKGLEVFRAAVGKLVMGIGGRATVLEAWQELPPPPATARHRDLESSGLRGIFQRHGRAGAGTVVMCINNEPPDTEVAGADFRA